MVLWQVARDLLGGDQGGKRLGITEILKAWQAGDQHALDDLTPQVYRELRRAAKLCMRKEPDGHTLQTTALINELYLRLGDLQAIDWQSRAHFLLYALGRCAAS